MKNHPTSMLLIEPKGESFRLVDRETTRRGFVRGEMPIVGVYPDKAQAREELCKLKSRDPQAVPL